MMQKNRLNSETPIAKCCLRMEQPGDAGRAVDQALLVVRLLDLFND
jgi:hypothetical protein